MSRSTENFDIADLKRSSVRMKGALQAEWQEEIKSMAPSADGNLDLAALDLMDDESRSFLPPIHLTLQLNGNFKSVSYVPTLSSMQGQTPGVTFNPLAISQMTC